MHNPSPPADPVAAATHCDPYAYYASLRRERPFDRDERLGLWVASSAETVASVLAHPAARVRPPGEPVPAALAGSQAGDLFGRLVRMSDGQAQRSMKGAIDAAARAFAGRIQPIANAWAARLAAGLGPDAEAQRLGDLAFALPVHAMADLLGLQPEDHIEAIRGVSDFARCLAPSPSLDESAAAADAADRLIALLGSRLETAAPVTILGGLSVHARAAGLDDAGIVANAIGLLLQARDATAALVATTLLTLARRPALVERVRGRPETLAAVVEEVARFDAPVQNTRRFLAEATVIAGRSVARGDGVLVLLAAANRDPAVNPEPDVFEPDRAGARSFTFGAGPHACPGRSFAVAIAGAAVTQFLASGLDLARLSLEPRYRPSPNLRMPDLVWTERACWVAERQAPPRREL
jgi:cytochrome P450